MSTHSIATNDRRTEKEHEATIGYVVFTDEFMSGWGSAPRRSLYALAVLRGSSEAAEILLGNGARRSEMRRGRYVTKLPRLHDGDHLSVVGPHEASRWYERGGF